MKIIHPFIFIGVFAAVASADPLTDSWLTTYSGKYARIYTSDANKSSGTPATTWSDGSTVQSSPAYCGVQEVYSSGSWVYIRSTGLGSHIMGPWYLNAAHTMLFPNFPTNQKTIYRFPRTPSVPASKTKTGGGPIGYFVDGVAMFNSWDAYYWNGSADVQSMGGGTGYWNRDAYVNEGVSFDPNNAHQAGGQHHYHANPPALRHLLGDHVDFESATRTYSESASSPQHSPILAWVADGYPLYGPYGYSNATNASSGVRRMISGYVLRNGQSNTVNLTTSGRTNIPQWAVRLYNVSAAQSGPNVSASYPLGRYMEDNDYLGDVTNSITHTNYQQGADFDLDQYNGRYCVTPEFPNGTYAYFVSISSTGTPTFPYNIGRGYYGSPTGGTVSSITETVTTNFLGGPNTALALNTPTVTNHTVTLVWSSGEGGTYQVASSTNDSTWTTNISSVNSPVYTNIDTLSYASGITTTTNYTGTNGLQYARVTRTALATFDTAGLAATVSQSATQSFTTVTIGITTQPTNVTAECGSNPTLSVAASGPGLGYQWYLSGSGPVSGGTNASLILSNASIAASGSYEVVVTNSAGSVTSQVATLTVSDTTPPVVTLNGNATTNILQFATYVELGATASDSCAGALTVTTLGSVNSAVIGTYHLVYSATDPSGNSAGVGRTVIVLGPPAITTQPASQTNNPGATVIFSAAGSSSIPFGYQWSNRAGIMIDGTTASGSIVSGSATAALTVAGIGPADTGNYNAIVTNSSGSATSAAAVLAMIVPVQPPQMSGSQMFCFCFASTNGKSYTIQQSTNTPPANWFFYTNITGNGSGYQFSMPVDPTVPYQYFRVIEP